MSESNMQYVQIWFQFKRQNIMYVCMYVFMYVCIMHICVSMYVLYTYVFMYDVYASRREITLKT
jgi:hypothetical protein